MPPQGQEAWVLFESDANKDELTMVPPSAEKRKLDVVWKSVIVFTWLHFAAIYGGYLFFFKALWSTRLFAFALYVCSILGITAGAHRLWSHKSYKARMPLKILLIVFNSIAFQHSALDWARDHRVHHKYSETDAGPYNATRGFIFSHIGWILVRKHPQVKAKGASLDMSDLWADPILRFQKKYYLLLMPLSCFLLPTYLPTLWGESLWNSFYVCAIFRYMYTFHITCLVNSLAHLWGNKPYDQHIKPTEIKSVSLITLGEGFHNYHHAFPWDYKTAEFGDYSLNFTKFFIDVMAKIGWAYDLKTVSSDIIKKRVKRKKSQCLGLE